VNDSIVPTKGFAFFGNVSYNHNFGESSKSFARFMGDLYLYVPLISKFSLAIRTGAATVTGNPEFYQYIPIGGGQTLRGYRRQRFWGKTAFYNSNSLRFVSDVKSYVYNGKAGLVAFFDNGRVWMPSQKSDKLHTGYGAGVLLAPFNKISAEITYSISKEARLIQLRISKPL
jgi:hemolysin activation/secretion protein